MTQLSEVGIANRALDKLGVERINDFEQNTKAARLMKENYPHYRDMMLRSHPWNFAIKRADLTLSATSPNHGFDNAYQLPNDFLRVLPNLSFSAIPNQGIKFVIEGDKFVTSDSDVKIRYVARITDTALFDDMFTEALTLKLAADLCYSLTQDKGKEDRLKSEFLQFMRDARSTDAMEGTPEALYVDTWIIARNRGTVFDASDF